MEEQEFEKANIFGFGDEEFSENFSESAYINKLAETDNGMVFTNVTYGPECETNWHIHASKSGGGQVLICTAGYGYYQMEGKPVQHLSPGDIVVVPPNVKHWHGTSDWFSQIEVEIPGEETEDIWLEPVPLRRDLKIKSKKENKEEIVKIIKDLNLPQNIFTYDVQDEIDNNLYIDITDFFANEDEYGCEKDNYNFKQFIKDILDVDKENTIIKEYCYFCTEEDSENYFYENGEIVSKTTREMGLSKLSDKQEIIAKIKNDFECFRLLSEEERKDFDYQMASLEAPYPSGYSSKYLVTLYTDEFLDNEETVRAIFKFGKRDDLFKTRVPSKYKEDFKLMSELLLIRPNYIKYLSNTFKENKELILKLIDVLKTKKNEEDYEEKLFTMNDISPKFKNNKEIALKMIELQPINFHFVSSRLKKDYDVCYKYISCGGYYLEPINNLDILSDISIMRDLIKKFLYYEGEYIKKISNSVKEDKEFLINFLIRINHREKDSLKLQKKFENMEIKEIISYAILNFENFHDYYEIIPKSLIHDKDIIKDIIEADKIAYNKGKEWNIRIPINLEISKDKEIMKMLKKVYIEYYLEDDSDTTKDD